MKELNGKLAEWAGLQQYWTSLVYLPPGKHDQDPQAWGVNLPDFTESLDACNKWLIPKLTYCCLVKPEHPSYEGQWGAMVRTKGGDASVYDKEAALALCLAIEKLIDGEAK